MSDIEIYEGRLAELRDDFEKLRNDFDQYEPGHEEEPYLCAAPGSPGYGILEVFFGSAPLTLITRDRTFKTGFERKNFQITVENIDSDCRPLFVGFEILREDQLLRVSMSDGDGRLLLQAGYFIYTGRRMLRLHPREYEHAQIDMDEIQLFEHLLDMATDKLQLKPDPPFDFMPVLEYVLQQNDTYQKAQDIWNGLAIYWSKIREKWDDDLNDY